LGTICATYHSAILIGAVAAYYKYGDRTDVMDKSLNRTREALNELKAYLGRALAEAVRPTVVRIISNQSPQTAADELRGEIFQDDVSAFVDSDLDEMLSYGRLVRARDRWSAWARRISWGILILLIIQGGFTLYFAILAKVLEWPTSKIALLITFGISLLALAFCLVCLTLMLYHHDEISKYRDKVL
jgi:hypothetical protein